MGQFSFNPCSDCEGIMSASYAILVALNYEDGIAFWHEAFGQDLSESYQPLTRSTANEDVQGIISHYRHPLFMSFAQLYLQ